jgi:hypothetical protein
VKAEGDGLDTEHGLCRLARSFDEKNEFCARTGFGLDPGASMFCNSSQTELLGLELLVGCRISNSWDFRGCNLAMRERCKAASACASLSLTTRFELEPSLFAWSELTVQHTILKFSLNLLILPMVSFSSL